MLVNDVSLRNLIPGELATGFGFYQSQPSSSFSPVAVTPDELGETWSDRKRHRPLLSHRHSDPFGQPVTRTHITHNFPTLAPDSIPTHHRGPATPTRQATTS